ncbi:hypothetical protein TB1_008743 [Malus domestica]
MPSHVLQNQSPFEILFGAVPLISHLKFFGCACFPLLKPYNSSKLQPKTMKCVFLGYASKYKGYICYAVTNHKFYISRHVIFNEQEFPYRSLLTTIKQNDITHTQSFISLPLPVVNFDNEIVSSIPSTPVSTHSESSIILPPAIGSPSSISPIPESNPPDISNAAHSSSHIHVDLDFQPDSLQVISSVPSLNLHPMQTRSKSGIVKKKVLLTTVEDFGGIDLNLTEPSTYKSALKIPVWMSAMKEELSAI